MTRQMFSFNWLQLNQYLSLSLYLFDKNTPLLVACENVDLNGQDGHNGHMCQTLTCVNIKARGYTITQGLLVAHRHTFKSLSSVEKRVSESEFFAVFRIPAQEVGQSSKGEQSTFDDAFNPQPSLGIILNGIIAHKHKLLPT